eukprot:NODE_22416_length_709_cov_3.829897.p3 GENE.NODE_22416_length_709_cov_3.829897~~NODE_22416_length_709_cov_3.829897.p3  ORF type:complete len:66 (+),score=17.39 NODE_22416_length_709_cov_3.829897:262-459(+)
MAWLLVQQVQGALTRAVLLRVLLRPALFDLLLLLLTTGCWLLAADCWLLTAGRWLLAAGPWCVVE